MTGGQRRAVSWIVSILVSGLALYYALRGVQWADVWRHVAAAQWKYLAGAAGITSFSFFLRAVRWRILLNAEASFDIPTVFWANMAGYLGNNFLPARAGEVIRSLLISGRSNLSRTYVLTTALSERLMDVIALLLWSSVVLLGVNPKPRWIAQASASMAVVAGAGALAVLILPHTGNLPATVLRRIPMPDGLRMKLLGLTEQVLLGMRAFHDWGRMGGFTILTAAVWSLDACTAMVAARAFDIQMSFPVAMLLNTGLGLGSALPSTPGYVGVYQFVAVTVLTPFGIGRDAALAYILVTQVVGYIVIVVWGLPGLYMLRGGWRGLTKSNAAGDDAGGVE